VGADAGAGAGFAAGRGESHGMKPPSRGFRSVVIRRAPGRGPACSGYVRASAEAARDVVLRALVLGVGEDVVGRALLDKDAEVEERGALRHTGGLLHRVGDDD